MTALSNFVEPSTIMGSHKPQLEMEQKGKTQSHQVEIYGGWKTLSLEDTVLSLEQGKVFPVAELMDIMHRCRNETNASCAARLHAHLYQSGLQAHPQLGNCLVSMLASVGNVQIAKEVFDQLVEKTPSSWNALTTGYAKCLDLQNAFCMYKQMLEDRTMDVSRFTYAAVISACARLRNLGVGSTVHADIASSEMLQADLFIGSSLVAMYARCGLLAKAQGVFDRLPVHDVVVWTALITGYEEQGESKRALDFFDQMQRDNVVPNVITYVSTLKACGSLGAIGKGQMVHTEATNKGLEKNSLLLSVLVVMYARCGALEDARQVFERLEGQDVVAWNALILGYAEHGQGLIALSLFDQMQQEGVSPTPATFVCCLKACSSLGALDEGLNLHFEIARKGLKNPLIACTLVDMYAKCGLLAKANEVFNTLSSQDVATWNALISGYVELGQDDEALHIFERMKRDGVIPDTLTSSYILKICGNIGAPNKGEDVHAEVVKRGLERDLHVSSVLIEMYAKCGLVLEATDVFEKLCNQDIVAWTAVITCYAQLGLINDTYSTFDKMVRTGVKPNSITFVSMLNACSHEGLVVSAQRVIEALVSHNIYPSFEHYTCLITLLGHAGRLDEVIVLIKSMPYSPDLVVWHSLLHSLQTWSNVQCAQYVFDCAQSLSDKDVASYISLSNIYVDTT